MSGTTNVVPSLLPISSTGTADLLLAGLFRIKCTLCYIGSVPDRGQVTEAAEYFDSQGITMAEVVVTLAWLMREERNGLQADCHT